MKRHVKLLLISSVLVVFCFGGGRDGVSAEIYPSRPISLIVPFAAGGPNDIVARVVAKKLGERLGQPVLVENRAGAGGSLGAGIVAKAAPDGQTLLFVGTSFGMQPALYSKLPYDTVKDFSGIAWLVEAQTVLMVPPALPARSVKELVALAKAKPGKLNFASNGVGSAAHLRGELFKSATGTDIVHVPYKGNSPLLLDLLAGRVSCAFADVFLAASYTKTGKLRALALSGSKRSPVLPDVPTMTEVGIAGFESSTWFGIVAPSATSREIIKKLHAETTKILRMPEVSNYLSEKGFFPVSRTPEEFDAHIKAEIRKWTKVVKEAAIPVED